MSGQPKKPGLISVYYRLTKPGIIYGNVFSAAAGLLLASGRAERYDFSLFAATMAGIAFVIAAGCVVNNYFDRGIDSRMSRTKHRALVTGQVSGRAALTFAAVLAAAGFTALIWFANALTVGLGVTGLFFYVVLYGITKRRGPYGTIVGSVSGATPIAAGYAAVTGSVDAGLVILFLIMAFWQMPHFYAIAMYRRDDYVAAGLPVLSVKRGMRATKKYILAFVVAFTVAAAALTAFDVTGYTYLIVMVALGMIWLWRGIQGFTAQDDVKWGGRMFGFSLHVLLIFCFLISVDVFLP